MLIINLSRDIWRLYQVGGRVEQTEEKLVEAEEENKQLKEKKEHYSSEDFLEKEIRDKLQLAKPGETIVILPQNIGHEQKEENIKEEQEKQTWQKWLDLFL